MRVLILGGAGMLGHKLGQVLGERFETYVAVRTEPGRLLRAGLFPTDRVVSGVDVLDADSLHRAFAAARPDVVVNAVGVIKQLPTASDPIAAITTNALLPHRLALACRAVGARLVHFSTDCVFSGDRGSYREDDTPDAHDLYGRSKLLGEVAGAGSLTLRTSIIGRELDTQNGLVEWFLSNRGGQVNGYAQVMYSGLPTIVLAEIVARLIADFPELSGLYQVASEPIDKYSLLRLVDDAYDARVRIHPVDQPRKDMSLDGRRFREATGIEIPPWSELVRRMAHDPTPYEQWRQVHAADR